MDAYSIPEDLPFQPMITMFFALYSHAWSIYPWRTAQRQRAVSLPDQVL